VPPVKVLAALQVNHRARHQVCLPVLHPVELQVRPLAPPLERDDSAQGPNAAKLLEVPITQESIRVEDPKEADITLERQAEEKVASAHLYVLDADEKTAAIDDDEPVELAPEEKDDSAEDPNASKLTEVPIAQQEEEKVVSAPLYVLDSSLHVV
jgi:hypothetical protein